VITPGTKRPEVFPKGNATNIDSEVRLRSLAATGLVLAVWMSIAAVFPFFMPPGRSLALIGPAEASVSAVIAANGVLLRADRMIVIARSDDPQFVSKLYVAGARLVLDAEDAGGCSGRVIAKRAAPATAF
jgi:hypothetical protein